MRAFLTRELHTEQRVGVQSKMECPMRENLSLASLYTSALCADIVCMRPTNGKTILSSQSTTTLTFTVTVAAMKLNHSCTHGVMIAIFLFCVRHLHRIRCDPT